MARKNLLADTDYTKGYDNRFTNAAWIGKVAKIECDAKHANIRVIMPDRMDHKNQPLISKPVPVLQIASRAKKSFAIPRLSDNVVVIKLTNTTSDYLVLGSFYTSKDPPPVTDPKLDYTEWEGGHTEKFDANDDADVFLTQDFKGGWKGTYKKDVELNTTDSAKFNIKADGDILINSANGAIDVKAPNGTVTIEQKEIVLQATTIRLNGHVIVNGNIDETGIHHDSNGFHTSGRDLEARVRALEARVQRLENLSSKR